MPAFNPKIVQTVRKECENGSIPMTEDVTSFLLGCHRTDAGSDVAFRVGQIGVEWGFSPDIDVLEMVDNEAIGYEIKGARGEESGVTKDQLYRGLGQAHLLLTDPVDFSERQLSSIPRIRKSYLVYPDGNIDASDEWFDTFISGIEDLSSVGLKTIRRQQAPKTVVEAQPNAPPPEDCSNETGRALEMCRNLHGDKFKELLSAHNGGKSVKNPRRSLEVLAQEIADEHGISFISF